MLRLSLKLGLSIALVAVPLPALMAQDLTPRAYTITPLRSNAVILSDALNDGDLLFEGTAPITDATGRLNISAVSVYHSLSVFGRSANVTATLPYGAGTFKGTVLGETTSIYRSGLFNSVFRFSVNLIGGRAMPLAEIRTWKQKTLLGVSLRVAAPTGQYDPTKLINLGANRWAFKPELGYSRHFRGHGCSTLTRRCGCTRGIPSSSRATRTSQGPRPRPRSRSGPSRPTSATT